jgi:BirA family biotin operon repressor/biotin-[acetyl-CoA-carboxylase] ligase
VKAYLSLGSNVGDRAGNLREAVQRLAAPSLRVGGLSAIYETEPQGRRDQPWFLNLVAAADTELAPQELLAHCLAVEAAMGRERGVRWGPRNIDIDVLLYGDWVVEEPGLSVPHPRLLDRAFALVPLAELAADAVVAGRRIGDWAALRRAEPGQEVRRWGTLEGAPATEPGRGGAGTWGVASPAPPPEVPSARAHVLARLRAAGGEALSGAALSRECGISRAAVWKHVRALRAEGYAIAGTAGSGYRLEPAAVPAMGLGATELWSPGRRSVGRVLEALPRVDSTNVRARQLGLAGAPDGTVVVAEEQTAGRGRNGRTFLSPLGGVYLSVLLRPRVAPGHALRLTLVAAVAVCEALEAVAGVRPRIKWPNDILLPEGKVCGILLEMVAREDCVDFVVLGCGLNVARAPALPGAASLWSVGATVGRGAVARAVLDALDAAYAAFLAGEWPALLGRWRSRCATLGAEVAVSGMDTRVLRGRAVDVTEDGALVVVAADGRHTILAGDVHHLREGSG